METTPHRREVYFHGRVQGVGFRYTTLRIAGGFAVTGYVQNLSDGRVKLVVEGEPPEIDAFLAKIAESFSAQIAGSNQRPATATHEFSEFEIRT
ncbi:MAG: acylphosphatase [Pirellulales bacterium]